MAALLINTLLLIAFRPAAAYDDRAALLSFFSDLTASSRVQLSDWNSPDVCNWTGILCHLSSPPHRVMQLDLSGRRLRGTISSSLINLFSLEVLDLSSNLLTGPIPQEIGHLSNLKQLSLSSNQLSGSIPLQLSIMNMLVYLDLGSNRLTGRIPPTLLCNSTALQYIDLSNNSLTGEILLHCEEVRKLNNLRFLLLWSNYLSGPIPPSLSNYSMLEWVDFESNYLGPGLPLQVFDKMPYLHFLHLSYNNLSTSNIGPFFTSLSNCSRLKELELAANGLGGDLPSSIGDLSPNLQYLHLEQNHIVGPIHPNISKLVNLTYLNLSNNELNGSIPPEIGRLRQLERLYLFKNNLSGNIPPSIGEITRLGLLDISSNELSGLIPDMFASLPQLRQLLLNNNRLSGQIPSGLGNCINLEILDLSHNQLTGSIPSEVAGLQSLKLYLNLSSNNIQGHLPLEFSKMDMILAIDLSCNNLSGFIPPQLGSCVALEYLNLSMNSLHGQLSSSIGAMPSLQDLDLSSNKLSGSMPEALQTSTTLRRLNLSFNYLVGVIPGNGVFSLLNGSSFEGNAGLCGHLAGIKSCETEQASRRSKVRRLVLYVIGTPCVLLLSFIGWSMARGSGGRPKCRLLSFRRTVLEDADEEEDFHLNHCSDHPRLSYQQLEQATDGFTDASLIGSGHFGRVYKGTLRSGAKIAVKVLDQNPGFSAAEISSSFKRECEVLRRTRHRNLIRIITACSRPDFKALVLPLMPNGSLENWLHPARPGQARRPEMSLEIMLKLASDVAEGMAYLHHHSPVRVVHCDLKPSNVLLDGDMTAVVADFGIARLVKGGGGGYDSVDVASSASCISTTGLLHGSVGYIPPEYGLGGHPSTQGDVYSFGILLLEIITGTRPTDVILHEGLTIHEWVKSHYPNKIESIILQEPTLNSPHMSQHNSFPYKKLKRDVILEFIELGLACTRYSPSMRPTMIDVANEIAILKQDISRMAAKP